MRPPGARAVAPLGPAQSAQLLKLVAVSGGRIQAERAIEALWPDVAPDAGRNRLRTVLDLCAAAAAQRGDLDEARRTVVRTIELAPYDDDCYLKVASILHEQGRRGAALSVLRRARATLAELGVPLPAPLRDLEETLVA